MTARQSALLITFALAATACGDSGICEHDALVEALATAMSGETVNVGRCDITGSFTIPSGVLLEGESRTESIIIGEEGRAVLTADPSGPVGIANLTIRTPGRAGIYANGAASRTFYELDIEATLGTGIAVENATSLDLRGIALTGPIDSSNASGVPNNAVPASHATHGLIVVGVADASLDNVTIRGFAGTGALFVTSGDRKTLCSLSGRYQIS